MRQSNYGAIYDDYKAKGCEDDAAIARLMHHDGFTAAEIARTVLWSKELNRLVRQELYSKENHKQWQHKINHVTAEFVELTLQGAGIEAFNRGRFEGWLNRPWEKLED